MPGQRTIASFVCTALLGLAAPALGAPQIGVAAAVRGSVQVLRPPAIGTLLASGEKLFLGDKVSTGPDAGLQILLLDETVFTLGPGSELTLDTFVYDPASGNGKIDAKLVKGAFRFISGRVARKDPRQMNVALPSGTIGIRGTIVYARIDAEVGSSTVVLAGPGEGNGTGETAGAIQVTNAGVSRDVLKSGWGVQIAGSSEPPSEPFRAPEGFFESFQLDTPGPVQDAAPAKSDGEKSDGSKSDTAKSGAAETNAAGSGGGGDAPADGGAPAAPPPVLSLASAAGAQLDSARLAAQAPQLFVDNVASTVLPIADPVPPPVDMPPTDMPPQLPPPILPPTDNPIFSPTLVADLTSLAGTFTGAYIYDAPGVPLANGGTLDLSILLDFSTQQINTNVKNVNSAFLSIQGTGGGAGFGATPFDNDMLEASYGVQFDYNDTIAGCAATCSAEVQFQFQNKVQVSQIAGVVSGIVTISQNQLEISDTATVTEVPVRVVP